MGTGGQGLGNREAGERCKLSVVKMNKAWEFNVSNIVTVVGNTVVKVKRAEWVELKYSQQQYQRGDGWVN